MQEKKTRYKNTSCGRFSLFHVNWEVGEVKEVPEEFKREKKFKYAIKLGLITEDK